MRLIFGLVLFTIRIVFCGYVTKAINESKGYRGGFWMGILLAELGILIAAFKKEQPNANSNAFRAVPVQNVLKKFHYPFVSPQVEPIDILKGNREAEAEAASINLTFLLIHGVFMLCWYSVILGAYLWYIMGYTVYWLFKYRLPNLKNGNGLDAQNVNSNINAVRDKFKGWTENAGSTVSTLSNKAKNGAAEKINLAKEKTSAFVNDRKISGNREPSVNDSSKEGIDLASENYIDEQRTYIEKNTSDYINKAEKNNDLYENNNVDEEGLEETNTAESYNTAYADINNDSAKDDVTHSISSAQGSNTNPGYVTRQLNYEEGKKPPVVTILVGVIAVLLVGMGILGGMLIMKNKDTNDNIVTSTVESVPTTNATLTDNGPVTQVATEAAIALTQKAITTTTTVTITTSVQKTLKEFSASDISKYPQYISAIKDGIDQNKFDVKNSGYALYDLNGDNTPEMIINTALYGVYSINGNTYSELMQTYTVPRSPSLALTDTGYLVVKYLSSQGENTTSYYKFIGGNEGNYENPSPEQIGNEMAIALTPITNIAEIKNYTEQKESSKYTSYDISAAGSDFTFNSSSIECKVNTDSGDLNLRAAPSMNGEVIKLMPKGALVYEFGHNHVWSYISYSTGGTTYYGYANKQFLVENNLKVQVISCNKKGTINASKGEVAGFAGSYVVDGGTSKLVRKTLDHGWHVTAVNYCNSRGILWYELYDTDDNDYYGWVDANFISFY